MPTPFNITNEAFWGGYNSWQENVENAYIKAQGVANRASYNSTLATSLSNADMLNSLPYRERKRLVENFRTSILGLNTGYMDQGFFSEVGLGGNDKMVGRFVSDTADTATHPLAYLLRGLSIQKDLSDDVAPGERYTVSGNIPRAQYLKTQMDRGLPSFVDKTITVFDTETMGLATDAGTVREISAVDMIHRGGRFEIDAANMYTKHLNVGRSAFGSIYDKAKGATVRMDDYVRQHLAKGAATGDPLDGRAFVEKVMPLLERINKADYVAGHNVGFDIAQTVGNLMKTSDYLNNRIVGETNVREAVDGVLGKINRGEILDTVKMTTEYFGNQLGLAPEFGALKSPRPFSLENIMMQTNMVGLMREDIRSGNLHSEFLNDIIMKGQHDAAIDTTITAKLIDYISTGRLAKEYVNDQGVTTPIQLGGGSGSGNRLVDLMLRKKILSSYAPTPVSNIADISHISPANFSRLYDEALTSDPSALNIYALGTGEPASLGARNADDWYKYLTDDTNLTHYGSVKFTLMEQHILDQRNLNMAVGEFDGVDSLGQWNRYGGYNQTDGGILNKLHTVFKRADIPDDKTFAAFQKRMANAGMPFAGISLEERILTGAMSTAAGEKSTINSLLAGTAEGKLARFSDDLSISRYAMRENFYTEGSVATIPLDIIKRAEAEGIITGTNFLGKTDDLQMMSISTVDSTRSVNLSVDVTKDDAGKLVTWLERSMATDTPDEELRTLLRARGLHQSELEDLRSMLDDGTLVERGINVGHLDEDAGRQGYSSINNLLQNLTRDKDKIPMRLAFLSSTTADEETGEGIIRGGAVVLDRFLSDDDKAAYRTNLKLAETNTQKVISQMGEGKFSEMKMKFGYETGGADELTKRADAIYGAIKSKGPAIAGAAALIFGGYYAYNKHQKQGTYDESIETMGYENANDYDKYRGEMGMSSAPATRRMDPLLTAGVVGNLDRNAIGHTNMSSDKHMNLFAGV